MPAMRPEPFNTHTALTACLTARSRLLSPWCWWAWPTGTSERTGGWHRVAGDGRGPHCVLHGRTDRHRPGAAVPVATFTGSYFEAHVTQHLLLMVVAPPLLALGAPSTLLLQTSSRTIKKKWLGVLRSRAFAIATYPMVVWFFYFGAMFAFFLSPLINYAMEHMALMDAPRCLPVSGVPLLVADRGPRPNRSLEDGLRKDRALAWACPSKPSSG